MNHAPRPSVPSEALAHPWRALTALIALPELAVAGDMDGVGAILMLYAYIGVAVVGGLAALVACRWIADPRRRLVARWLIVVLLYTPVPFDGSAFPAFLVAWSNHSPSNAGVLGHPLPLAYAGALLLSAPVIALWLYVSRRYPGGRVLESQTQ